MQESGLTEIIPFLCTSAIWGQYLVLFTSWVPQCSVWGVAAIWWPLCLRYFSLSWVPLGLRNSHLETGNPDDCDILADWHGRKYSISQVGSLFWEDPTCRRATKPVHPSYWARALPTTEARASRTHAPQQEKPPQWEACAPQCRVAPTGHNQRKPMGSNKNPAQP